MKKRNVILILLIMSLISLGAVKLLQYQTSDNDPNFRQTALNFQPPRNGDDLLDPDEMMEDLKQLKKDLEEVHPKTIEGLPKELEVAFETAFEAIKSPMTVNDFTILASELTCIMQDAHTSIYLGAITPNNRPISLNFKRIENDFFVVTGKDLEPKDRLIAIGGKSMEELYDFFKKLIPTENPYWYDYKFESIIKTPSSLVQAGATINENSVEVVVERGGNPTTVTMEFGDIIFEPIKKTINNEKQYITYPKGKIVPYRYYIDVENDLAHFVITQCNNTPDYRTFLKIMFDDIHSKNINNIVVDVRGNIGGNSSVIDEFLKYYDVEKYENFGLVRRLSQQSSEQRPYKKTSGEIVKSPDYMKNNPVDGELFKGNTYVLIDHGTFSSGNWFGIILADNGIGTLVGEPTGNAPSSYGDVLSFQLPNSKLIYNISYTQWIRPNEEKRHDDALYPDIEVKYTIDDYVEKRDLPMEAVIKLIKGE